MGQVNCTFSALAATGDTCQSMAKDWGITTDQFLTYNPSVGANCVNGVQVGKQYCVEATIGPISTASSQSTSTSVQKTTLSTSTALTTPSPTTKPTSTTTITITTSTPSGPSPTQAGVDSSCTRFHQVVSGDNCQAIQSKYGTFTLSDFYKWNPSVGVDCSALWLGYYVCIGIPGTPTNRPPPPKPTQNGPAPQQFGIPASCNNFYLVNQGDYCQKIADQYRISLQQFYTWNPSVGSDCKSLWGGLLRLRRVEIITVVAIEILLFNENN